MTAKELKEKLINDVKSRAFTVHGYESCGGDVMLLSDVEEVLDTLFNALEGTYSTIAKMTKIIYIINERFPEEIKKLTEEYGHSKE